MQRRNRNKNRAKQKTKILIILLSLVSLAIIGSVIVETGTLFKAHNASVSKTIETVKMSKRETEATTKVPDKVHEKTPIPISSTVEWIPAKSDNELPILMFHYVSSNPSDLVNSNWMPAATFDADMKALKDAGYTTVNSEEAIKILTTHTRLSKKMVWLTFDDGSLTVYRDIFPILKKYNMHATAFIITGFVDNNQGGILTWEQIKEMKASGLVDFQSHTVSHLDLGTLSDTDATAQLQQSKAELDRELAQNTDIICYPAGGYNQGTLQIAQSLGYKYGLTDPGRNGAVAEAATISNGALTLPRFRMSSTTDSQTMMQMLAPSEAYNAAN